jgi:hypothetical protein
MSRFINYDAVFALLSMESDGFYLNGSRYFNSKFPDEVPITEYTDWDFRVEYSEEALSLLDSISGPDSYIDFIYKDFNDYYAPNTVAIWRDAGIQVVIEIDSFISKDTFYNMDADTYINYVWKSGPKSPHFRHRREFIGQAFNSHPKARTESEYLSLSNAAASLYADRAYGKKRAITL